MAKKRDRVIAGFFAAVFIISTLAVSVGLLIQTVLNNKKSSDDTPDSTATTKPKETPMEDTSNTPKLEGTKLAGFTPVGKVDKLSSTDTKAGTGETVKAGATITFHYTGALASDGTIFQSSHDSGQPITYPLGQLIKGWQEGIPGMKVGGERRLLIPYAKGYGGASQPGIPAKSDLVFDIEVTAIQK